MLSLTALACLPIALSKLVRDAGVSLLLPLTFFGAVLAWALAGWGVRKLSSGIRFIDPRTPGFMCSNWSNGEFIISIYQTIIKSYPRAF